jgi:hypothetical protein
MIGLRLAFTVTLVLVGLFSPDGAAPQHAAKIARIGYLESNLAANPYMHGPSVKDCVTSVMSRAATS